MRTVTITCEACGTVVERARHARFCKPCAWLRHKASIRRSQRAYELRRKWSAS